jgi:hypothetical protein
MDFQDDVAQPFLAAFQEKAVQGWYTADLGAAASGIINVMSTTQFRLRFTSRPRTGPSYLEFYSGDAADQNQPRLIVNYYLQ